MTGYKVAEAEGAAHLENLLNLLSGQGWKISRIFARGGRFVVVSYRVADDRHEFRPRDWRPGSTSSDAEICAMCHHFAFAPWHMSIEEPPPHPFKYVDEKDRDFIACYVCGKFPEHPTHKGIAELVRSLETMKGENDV
jgi:hypothetical protein